MEERKERRKIEIIYSLAWLGLILLVATVIALLFCNTSNKALQIIGGCLGVVNAVALGVPAEKKLREWHRKELERINKKENPE